MLHRCGEGEVNEPSSAKLQSHHFRACFSPRNIVWLTLQIEADAANVGFNLENELQHSDRHGKCNAVFVGFGPSADQYATLRTYSETFKVWVVLQCTSNA